MRVHLAARLAVTAGLLGIVVLVYDDLEGLAGAIVSAVALHWLPPRQTRRSSDG